MARTFRRRHLFVLGSVVWIVSAFYLSSSRSDVQHEGIPAFKIRMRTIQIKLKYMNLWIKSTEQSKDNPEKVLPHNKENLKVKESHQGDDDFAVLDSEILPVLVIACNRVTVKRTLDQLLKYRPSTDRYPIIVSQDCGHGPTADVIKSYKGKIKHIQHPDLSEAGIHLPKKKKYLKGYYAIARHFKWALNQTFNLYKYTAVIIVEDDLDIAPDFFEYFAATYRILRSDDSLWCISAWNDNGKPNLVDDDPSKLYRTEYFPGLGWLLERKVWQELEPKWPEAFWDDWMMYPEQRKNRSCIRPEVSRTKTFGKKGVSGGQLYEKHLKFMKLNDKFVPFRKLDLSYLIKHKYDEMFSKTVYNAPVLTTKDIIGGKKREYHTGRVLYDSEKQFKELAKTFGIMPEFKSGIPRTGYMGVVTFIVDSQRIYLASKTFK